MANNSFATIQHRGECLSSDDEVLESTVNVNPDNLLTEESSSSDDSSWKSGAFKTFKVNNRPIISDDDDDDDDKNKTLDGAELYGDNHRSNEKPPGSHKSTGSNSEDTDEPQISPSVTNLPGSRKSTRSSSEDTDEPQTSSPVTNLPGSHKITSSSSEDTDEPQTSSPVTHHKEKVTLKNKQSKNIDEVVDLTSTEYDIDLNKITQDIVANRETNLKAEKQRLELETMDITFQLKNFQTALESLEVDKLPDKGARMKHNLLKKKKELQSIAERQSFIDKQLKAIQNEQKNVPYIDKLPTASMNLSDLGKKALETHNIQRALTVDTLEKIHKSLETQPKSFTVEPKYGLKVSLLPHQKYALGWALWRESQNTPGGILADDMGLGKTLTMISLILHTLEENKSTKSDNSSDDDDEQASRSRRISKGGTLVITPASVMGQWENEVKSKVISGKISCYLYHGPTRKKRTSGIHRYNVVLSTYSTILNENEDDPLMNIRWKRIILDEAHIIRNSKSKTALSIFNLKGGKRWALTGTPVQNKELDLYSILRFLRCKPFDDFTIWKRWIDNKDTAGIQRLNCILKATLLRRTKEELKTEGSLASLKSKTFHNVTVSLNEEEYKVYKKVAYFSKTLLGQLIHQKAEKENLFSGGMGSLKSRFKDLSEENPFRDHPELRELYKGMTSMGNVKTHHILVLLLRLRQICCHPALAVSVLDTNDLKTDGIENDQPGDLEVVDRLHRMSLSNTADASKNNIFQRSTWSSKLRAVIDCIMDILEKTEDKIIVVSQWKSVLDIVQEYLNENDVDSVEFTGSILVKQRPAIIKEFNENVRGPRVMLLSLMAGGVGLNLIGANHLLLIDCHWNPQLESQACDRIYRVGQPKEVHIYKFICGSTIEERIVDLQKKKLELSEGVLKGSINTNASKLTLNDLKALFNLK